MLREVLSDFKRKVVRVFLGFDRRFESKVEHEQRQKCDALTDEDAENFVLQEDINRGRNKTT